jgi:DNA-binding transcriptional MerR regulator
VSVRLLIGEVAELLGVTTKTIRYYEKIGLLDEADRTESGYRLYQTQDLLRLYRIKQMQDLGLSLERIRILLQEPDRIQAARDILQTLEEEITAQIAELEVRRSQVRELLAQETENTLMRSQELPPTLQLLQEHLGEQVAFDPTTATEAEHLWAQMDIFLWKHAEYQQQQRELIQHMATHPEARVQIANFITRVAALAQVPAETAEITVEVEELADEIVSSRINNPILVKMMSFGERFERSNADMLAQVLLGAMEPTPLQRRLFKLVEERLDD